jgi:hypothetical protein
MRRSSLPFLVLAVALALLLPLEQAHCMWMGPASRSAASRAPMAADHACCTGHAASQTDHATTECPCLRLPPAAIAQAVTIASPGPSVLALAHIVRKPSARRRRARPDRARSSSHRLIPRR